MKSYLTHLECTNCGATHSADQLIRLCTECGKVLYARYDLDAARRDTDRDALAERRSDMWRYFETMPVLDEQYIVSLGEGMTPILDAPRLADTIGATNLVIKDEGQNPTGTFKSRGLSAAVSKAKELGAAGVTIPTAGNAGGALAAYAARAGMDAHVFMPQDALDANKKEVTHAGGTLHLVDGLIGEAGQQSRELGRRARHVRPLDPPGAVSRRGKEDHGLRDCRAVRLDIPRRDHLPHRRRHRRRRNLESHRRA